MCTTNAQITIQLKEKADSLHRTGIDTILFYQPYWSPTTNEADGTCIIHEKGYLLWRQGTEIFILKNYYCINFLTNSNYQVFHISRQQDTLEIFDYLASNFKAIANDKMLKSVLRTVKNGKEQLQDFNKIDVFDDSYTGILILVGNKTYDNGYSSNDLNDGIIRNVDGTTREVWESLNYKTNIEKSIYKIIKKIDRQIATLEKSKVI